MPMSMFHLCDLQILYVYDLHYLMHGTVIQYSCPCYSPLVIDYTYCWSAWLSGRTSVSGQRSFAVLHSTYS